MSALNWCISSRYTGHSADRLWQNGQLRGCSIYIPLIPCTNSPFDVGCKKLRLPLAFRGFFYICWPPCTAIRIRVNQRLRSDRLSPAGAPVANDLYAVHNFLVASVILTCEASILETHPAAPAAERAAFKIVHFPSYSTLPQLLPVCRTSLYMVRICTRPRDFYRPQGIDCACMVHLSSRLSLRRMGIALSQSWFSLASHGKKHVSQGGTSHSPLRIKGHSFTPQFIFPPGLFGVFLI